MYHGITYADEAVLPEDAGQMTVRFWNPVMKRGIIAFVRPEECTKKRHIHEMAVKKFEEAGFSGLQEFTPEEYGGGEEGLR
jgi:CRISPR-associated protein Cas5d